jgi:drug/metabolite transporter (DMT)-like permease
MANTNIAASLALGSALCVAIGDVLQQQAAHRIADSPVGHLGLLADLVRNRRWWLGIVLLAASIALQAAALNEGSVLLVQALVTLSLLFALPINARFSARTVSGGEWIWAAVLTAAVILVVVVGNPRPGRTSAPIQTWVIVAAVFGPILIGCLFVGRIRGGAVAATSYAFVAGSLWGVFAVLTKEVVARLGDGGRPVTHSPELYAWLLAAAGGFVWGQSAFRAGPLTASMPALQMSQPVVAAVLGVVVLGEKLNASRTGLVAMAFALVAMMAAVFRLARVEAVATRRRVDEQLQDAVV